MTYAPTTNNDQSFMGRQSNKVAWRRSWLISLAIGVLGTVAASDNIKNVGEAFGYTVGYGGAVFVMGTGATMACGKSLKETSKPIS